MCYVQDTTQGTKPSNMQSNVPPTEPSRFGLVFCLEYHMMDNVHAPNTTNTTTVNMISKNLHHITYQTVKIFLPF